ncbi:FadR/GntR family transcriptional regulator [Bosea sp. PAMC 26642]|uniref:FadR/GntR family transcriptional regulator n=1 Tax=Bosea sp. (strain PAMC 26642) TaxID=1792307 RepID=UPI00076FF372|nr:FadR/GntR family transcriptional regulator [Bosea sp. PAMC 26642]AMJ63950.1 GntR family transcriptional regulator [Bosea sp. PAMC 26642]
MPLEAVESPRLYRQIADQLRGLIERREFPVGSRLPAERELAEKLGVSRPSVREALIALEVEGRVRIRMGSGVYVVDRPPMPATALSETPSEGPFELLKARELIESAVCVAAAGSVSPADLVTIDDILHRMSDPDLSGDELVALDRAFHVAVTGIMRNAVLVRFVGELFDKRINPYFQQLARYFENVASWRAALVEHHDIRNALAGHDARAAGEAMSRHLSNSQERFSQSFGEAGPINGQASVSARPRRQN